MSNDLTRRIEELESQLAFQEALQSQLNDVVARQDRELRQLKTQLDALADRLAEFENALPDGAVGPADETPPHY